jgi:prepilin-type N-terminal cleavage/methylation domain-containing protein
MKLDLRNLFTQNFLKKTLFKKAFSLIEISIVVIIIAILTGVIYEATE